MNWLVVAIFGLSGVEVAGILEFVGVVVVDVFEVVGVVEVLLLLSDLRYFELKE